MINKLKYLFVFLSLFACDSKNINMSKIVGIWSNCQDASNYQELWMTKKGKLFHYSEVVGWYQERKINLSSDTLVIVDMADRVLDKYLITSLSEKAISLKSLDSDFEFILNKQENTFDKPDLKRYDYDLVFDRKDKCLNVQ